MNTPSFCIWKTIRLGEGPHTIPELRAALIQQGSTVGSWLDGFRQETIRVVQSQTELKLLNVSVAELGFPHGARTEEILARAKQFGFKLCPPETGPQLRLQYPDQPHGETLLIAMVPLRDGEGDTFIFYLGHTDSLWILGYYSDDWPAGFWFKDRQWVFAVTDQM